MFNIPKISNFVLYLAIFTLLLNLVNFTYTRIYFKYYNNYNDKFISDFQVSHNNKLSENDFTEMCSSLKPPYFLSIYGNLMNWSLLAMEIFVPVLFVFMAFKKETLPKRTSLLFLTVLLIVPIMYFFSLDGDYDLIICQMNYNMAKNFNNW